MAKSARDFFNRVANREKSIPRPRGHSLPDALLCLTIRVNNHDFDMQSLEGVTLPRTVAVRRPQ